MGYEFEGRLTLWPGQAKVQFVLLPKDYFEEIKEVSGAFRRGFGAVRVEASCGSTTWRTSIFPLASEGSYMLMVKADVRKKEKLVEGSVASYQVELIDF
jgi:Domain of unknown function (DUF1905)